jgi:hypothetical protein
MIGLWLVDLGGEASVTDYQARYECSYALVIGIDDYRYLPSLGTAVRGAQAVAEVLEGQYGFKVTRLLDKEATWAATHDACLDLRSSTGDDDRLVIYFAGHGLGLESPATGLVEGWLALHDTKMGQIKRMIRMTDMTDPSFTRAKHALVLLDACHSGLAVTYGKARAVPLPSDPRRALEHFLTRRAYQVIASANPLETATDAPLLEGNTPFTGYLLRALRGEDAAARDPVTDLLTANSVSEYVRSSMAAYYRNWQGPQDGILPGDGGGVLVWHVPVPREALPGTVQHGLESDDPDVRCLAIDAAARLLADALLGVAARKVLKDTAANDPDAKVRQRALDALIATPAKPVRVAPPPSDDAISTDNKSTIRVAEPVRLAITPASAHQVTALNVLGGHTAWVNDVAFSPNGQLLATGSDDKTARLWEVKTGLQVNILRHTGGVGGVAFSPDGRLLATAGWDKAVRLWEVKTGKQVGILEHADWVRDVDFSRDGRLLASAGGDKTARLWEVKTGKQVGVLEHTDWVRDVDFSPDGRLLATASEDGAARLWEVKTGKQVAVLLHAESVRGVDFNRDGSLLATASEDATARLWEVETEQQVAVLRGHAGRVYDVAFSPDGRLLATSGRDATLRLWEVKTKRQVAVLEGHTNRVYDVAFNPNGSLLASASRDNTARLWGMKRAGG